MASDKEVSGKKFNPHTICTASTSDGAFTAIHNGNDHHFAWLASRLVQHLSSLLHTGLNLGQFGVDKTPANMKGR